jgi:hypothetical protein
MVTTSYRIRPLIKTATLTALAGLALALPVSACASGASRAPAASGTVQAQQAAASACQQVSAVLTDGPDPGADPVGYAQAQILQLRLIHTPDSKIQQAIDGLASAYNGYSSANGASKPATAAANAAITEINKLCPGAGAVL